LLTLYKFRKIIHKGNPTNETISTANSISADAIIMTTAGYRNILDLLRGNTTEQVARKTSCPLLTIPQSWNM